MKFGLGRLLASVNAVPMSPTATVRVPGVGVEKDAAKTLPTTWLEVANCPLESRMRENPVMELAAMGLTAIAPAGRDVQFFFLK